MDKKHKSLRKYFKTYLESEINLPDPITLNARYDDGWVLYDHKNNGIECYDLHNKLKNKENQILKINVQLWRFYIEQCSVSKNVKFRLALKNFEILDQQPLMENRNKINLLIHESEIYKLCKKLSQEKDKIDNIKKRQKASGFWQPQLENGQTMSSKNDQLKLAQIQSENTGPSEEVHNKQPDELNNNLRVLSRGFSNNKISFKDMMDAYAYDSLFFKQKPFLGSKIDGEKMMLKKRDLKRKPKQFTKRTNSKRYTEDKQEFRLSNLYLRPKQHIAEFQRKQLKFDEMTSFLFNQKISWNQISASKECFKLLKSETNYLV